MAAEASDPEPPPQLSPPFLEVECKPSKKKRRFAAGTKAGFAVSLINRKLNNGQPLAFAIEAIKEGEEPVSFGPDVNLVDYGNGWKLQAVTDLDYPPPGVMLGEKVPLIATPTPPPRVPAAAPENSDGSRPGRTIATKPAAITAGYMMKILVAFILIFMLGAVFTIALENLPKLILMLNSM
ncbi:unnamed protein product [Linum tenue]|uniref:Uncharacterized protein n=1 Tax=Linum tenue TaxID=586396 RepID=A0AAV0HKS3_9ROSI|nr:unnamed protein product [Linum tenue]